MSGEKVYAVTPVGRLVMGSAFVGNDKDQQGRPALTQSGQPKITFFMGLAIPKTDPGLPAIWQEIHAVAQRDFPGGEWQNHNQRDQQGRPIQDNFAMRIDDGDVRWPDRPECAGQMVIRMSGGYPPTVHDATGNQLTDPACLKCGDYIRAQVSIVGNDNRQKPGVYINPLKIQIVGYGEAIMHGPSAAEVFAAPAAMPPGASATPVASGPMPGYPPQAAPAAPPPAAPAPGYPPQAAPPPAAPAPGYPPQAAPPPAAPAPGYPPANPTAPGAPVQGAPDPSITYAAPPTTPPAFNPAQPVQTSSPSNAPPYPAILNPGGPTQ